MRYPDPSPFRPKTIYNVQFQRHHNAAIVIQSFYRGCQTRQKLKNAAHAMSKFQQSYRKKIEAKQTLDEKKRFDRVKKDHDERQRRKGFVKSKTKQLQVLSLPSVLKKVNKFE